MEHFEGFVGSATVHGKLSVELPCAVGNAIVRGHCELGAFTYFNKGTDILDCSIGRYCSIGANVLIGPGLHPTGYVTTHPIAYDFSGVSAGLAGQAMWAAFCGTGMSVRNEPQRARQVVIENDVWIGSNAVILAGLRIGTGAIVGAGAVVTRDVAPYSIVAGNPARHLRYRIAEELVEALLATQWWRYDLSALGAERDYSDVGNFIALFESHRGSGRLVEFEPETLLIEQGKTVSSDLRKLFMQEMEMNHFAAARALLEQGARTRRQRAVAQEVAARDSGKYWEIRDRKKTGKERAARPAAIEIGALEQGPAFLRNFRERFGARCAAPVSALDPEFSTIFLHLNVSGGGALIDALASLYFPWEVRDTVARPALLEFLAELPALRHAIPLISWHGGGWAVPFPRDKYRIFTMAREPVARFLSYHNTLLTHGDSPWVPECVRQRQGIDPLIEFESERGNGNTFAIQVCTLEIEPAMLKTMSDAALFETARRILSERYFLVGVTEHYDVSLLVACLLMGFEKVPRWNNRYTTARVAGRVAPAELGEESRARIERLFAVDIALYRWIKEQFTDTYAEVFDFVAGQGLRFDHGGDA